MSDDAHLDPTLSAPTDGRTWGRSVYVAPTHPQPLQRAVVVEPGATCVPPNARKMAKAKNVDNVRITHARGYDTNTLTGEVATKRIMEPTGEFTDKGNPRMKKIGEEPAGPVDSIRAVAAIGDKTFVGHWIDGGWDYGMILVGRHLDRMVNWTQLWKEFNAASSADMRGEDGQGVLPLESDEGKSL